MENQFDRLPSQVTVSPPATSAQNSATNKVVLKLKLPHSQQSLSTSHATSDIETSPVTPNSILTNSLTALTTAGLVTAGLNALGATPFWLFIGAGATLLSQTRRSRSGS